MTTTTAGSNGRATKATATKAAPAKAPVEPAAAPAAAIEIERLELVQIVVPIVGLTPLIVHKFSEKSKRQMLDNMQGQKKAKQHRDPKADYDGAFYRLADGSYGFPVLGFKGASVSAARHYRGLTMTMVKQLVFFSGGPSDDAREQLARIEGEPFMREDVVTVGVSGTDLRYRPQFTEWRTTLDIQFVPSSISLPSVLALIDAGGMTVGVGEWRPEKSGNFGRFQIDPDREVQVIGR